MSTIDEFDVIHAVFAPLATDPGAAGLRDDGATVATPSGETLAVTCDTLVAGVHCLRDDPLDVIAHKALRTNLSDLAAMGATPRTYLLAVAWPESWEPMRLAQFAAGLSADQAAYGVTLLGGDTTATPGPLTITITAFGEVGARGPIRRAGARVGDVIGVTGTIGDAGLGLIAAREGAIPGVMAAGVDHLIDRYRIPQPRTAMIDAVAAHANAAVDVSDGLIADAGHIAAASGVAITLDLERLPLSAPAAGWAAHTGPDARARLAAMGDDYELVLTAPPDAWARLEAAAAACDVRLTTLGQVEEGEGVHVIDAGQPVCIAQGGYTHF